MQDEISLLGGLTSPGLLTWSRVERSRRHRTDYEVLRVLGSGGYGRVHLVRHKLDGNLYAMKVVRMTRGRHRAFSQSSTATTATSADKVLREVEALSSINSEHVVRYYSAWVEHGEWEDLRSGDGSTTPSWLTSTETREEDAANCDPMCNLCQSMYKDWEVGLEQWGLLDAVLQPMNLCIDCYRSSVPADVDISNITIRETKVLPECLFIVMEYCETTLLESVADLSPGENMVSSVWSYFCQTVQGLSELHANGVIHRDIKPTNIFLNKGIIKIGDLGLATSQELVSTSAPTSDEETAAQTNGEFTKSADVGTLLYMAPEVSRGGQYDEKADIYSLGILLVEIFNNFGTTMERIQVLRDVRSGRYPPEWAAKHPAPYKLAQRLLDSRPSSRPSCAEILREVEQMGMWQGSSADHIVAGLQLKIQTLQEQVQQRDAEICRLRQLLHENGIKQE